MPNHEFVICPRCQQSFECKVGTIQLCHCSDAKLSPSQRAYVAKHWDSCLCANCLRDIKRTQPAHESN